MDTTTIVTQVVTNVLLCLIMGWQQWKRKQGLVHTQLTKSADRAVRDVQSSYTRPIVLERLQHLVDDPAPRGRRRTLGCTRQAIRLTSEEKQNARQRAVTHLRRSTGASTHDLEGLIEDAYYRLPPLSASTIVESKGMLQLLSKQHDDVYIPNTPIAADDFV
jgi:hypothetical protein